MQSPEVYEDPVVRRRHVFFIPGYDPNAPRRYRELYRKEGQVQAGISGYDLDVKGLTSGEGYRWQVVATIDGVTTETIFELLTWQDLVRGSMERSVISAMLAMLKTAWIYISTGALRRLWQLRPQPMIAALYPMVMVFLQLAIAYGLGRAVAWSLSGVPGPLSAGAGIAAFLLVMVAAIRWDRHFYVYYLINDYAYTAHQRGRYPDELTGRIGVFADRIVSVAKSDVDEVLIVGHSSGAQLAVSALTEAVGRVGPRPVLSLLTLGQVIPMLSFLPEAGRLRTDLNRLSRSERIAWVDVSAPGDGACFALSDPVHVSGVAPSEAEKRWPKVISAAFNLSLSPDLVRRTKFRFFRRHIQYLCAFDRPRDYDYFQITAGPRTLEDRFAWRGATATRDERPLSPFRSVA